jgi:hypothetical protein
LKGLSGAGLNTEIEKYIKLLELEPKENAASSTLSGGMKRKLAAGVALCGGSKVSCYIDSSSSTSTTAHCGLWPVEQDPFFPICHQLSPLSLNPSSFFPFFDFRNNKFFTVWGC